MGEILTSEAIIKDSIKTIKELISENHLLAAYQAIKEIQHLAPYSPQLQKLQNLCVEGIKKRNIELIDDQISALKPLWRAEDYKKLVQEYEKLAKIDPSYKRLQKLLDKAKKNADLNAYNTAVSSINQFLDNAKSLLKNNKLKEALQECEKALTIDSMNGKAKDMLLKIKDTFVENEISSEKFNQMEINAKVEYLKELQKVSPENRKLIKLLEKNEKNLFKKHRMEEKSFIATGISKAKFFIRQHMYEKAFQAIKEVLAVSPRSVEANKMNEIIERKYDDYLTDKIAKDLAILRIQSENEYKQNKSEFIKIY